MSNKIVGCYTEKFNQLTGQNIKCGDIYQSDGLIKHVRKYHEDVSNNMEYIPMVIASPDYVGHNPKEPESVELVKYISDNIMVCVKLDSTNEYLYVASMYKISESKLNNRIKSGRLKKF